MICERHNRAFKRIVIVYYDVHGNIIHGSEPSRMKYFTINQHSLNAKQTTERYNMLRMIKAIDIDVVQQIDCRWQRKRLMP